MAYNMTKKLLSQRKAHGSELLSSFDCQIVYRPGKLNGKAEVLMRRPGDLPEVGNKRLKNMEHVVLKP